MSGTDSRTHIELVGPLESMRGMRESRHSELIDDRFSFGEDDELTHHAQIYHAPRSLYYDVRVARIEDITAAGTPVKLFELVVPPASATARIEVMRGFTKGGIAVGGLASLLRFEKKSGLTAPTPDDIVELTNVLATYNTLQVENGVML